MGKLFTPLNIGSGFNTTASLNGNFAAIEDAFDKTLARTGEAPNQMIAHLDMNGFDILNVGEITIGNIPIHELIQDAIDAANNAEQSAIAANQSAIDAATYAALAEQYKDAALDAYNNIRYAQIEERTSSFSIEDSDTLKILLYTGTDNITVTLPGTVTTGVQLVVVQGNTGTITFSAPGQDIVSVGGAITTTEQGAPATLIKLNSGWFLAGQVE